MFQTYYSLILKLICLTISYSLGIFYMGYTALYFNSISFKIIYAQFHITIEESLAQGLISGIIFLGAAFGALITSPVLKMLSRRQTCFFFNTIAVIGGIMVLITNQYILLIGRFLQGISIAANSIIIPIIIQETIPISLIGPFVAFQMSFIALGYFMGAALINIFSLFDIQQNFWRYTFGITLLTVLAQTILIKFVYFHETPKYLILKGQNQKAKEALAKIYCQEKQQENYYRILQDLQADVDEQIEHQQKDYPKDSKLAIFLGIFIMIGNALTGINIIVLYQREIAQSFIPQYSTVIPTIINFFKFITSFFAVFLYRKIGRKKIFVYGAFFMAACLMTITLGFTIRQQQLQVAKYLTFGGIFIYIAVFVNSWGALTWVYPAQILQPIIIPYLQITNWLGQCLLTALFPIIRSICGDQNCPIAFLFFSICMIVAGIVMQLLAVQTKDKSQLQIRQQLNKKQICLY